MSDFLEQHRFLKGASLLFRRYYDHRVARDSAALTYYLLFALFPLLIFLNNLVGVISFDLEGLLRQLARIIPQEAVEVIEQYLRYVSRTSSRRLLMFSLIFSIYFPFRAAGALFLSVRKAYGMERPSNFLRYQARVLLYTIVMIVAILAAVALSAVGRRALEFASGYVYLSDGFIRLWSSLRFVVLGALLFGIIVLLYALAQDDRREKRSSWPGVVAALVMWMALSMLFSLYVENAAQYSVLYGSLGTIIVLLLWLYLAATMLIMGAEFNAVLLEMRKDSRETKP